MAADGMRNDESPRSCSAVAMSSRSGASGSSSTNAQPPERDWNASGAVGRAGVDADEWSCADCPPDAGTAGQTRTHTLRTLGVTPARPGSDGRRRTVMLRVGLGGLSPGTACPRRDRRGGAAQRVGVHARRCARRDLGRTGRRRAARHRHTAHPGVSGDRRRVLRGPARLPARNRGLPQSAARRRRRPHGHRAVPVQHLDRFGPHRQRTFVERVDSRLMSRARRRSEPRRQGVRHGPIDSRRSPDPSQQTWPPGR